MIIKNLSGSVLHTSKEPTIKLAVEEAVRMGADLSWADLSGADLSGAILSGAYLFGAYLFGAYLFGAYLFGADLRWADLRGANLFGVKFDKETYFYKTKIPRKHIPEVWIGSAGAILEGGIIWV
jgi:uncharacterized protein YjbI with pentapeptide repeats